MLEKERSGNNQKLNMDGWILLLFMSEDVTKKGVTLK
jgi:hypothetical protein